MKIIIDNSILNAGGGIQVAMSFLQDLIELNLSNEYHIIQSPNIAKILDKNIFPDNFIFYDISEVNHKSISKRISCTKKIENEIKPECIFTVFGPSYHRSKYPKVVGFALPYIIYPNSPFFDIIPLKERIKFKLMGLVKTYFFKRNSNAIIFESDDAKDIFRKKISSNIKTYTVNNTLNSVFDSYVVKGNMKDVNQLNILCLSANYPHKNLNIIPRVIDEIEKINPKLNFKFNISANKSDFNFDSKYNSYINFLGRVEINNLPDLYEKMDVLFMPTLLEVFSTTYLEAMFMQIPIVCSDMSFARDICANSAVYCSPVNAKQYAENIVKVYTDVDLKNNLVKNGLINLERFGDSKKRTLDYLYIIKQTINARNKK